MMLVSSKSDPAEDALSVTPSDADPLPCGVARGLMIAATGNVSFITKGGTTVSLTSVPAFTVIPIQVRQVRSTGTTATVLALI